MPCGVVRREMDFFAGEIAKVKRTTETSMLLLDRFIILLFSCNFEKTKRTVR